MVQYWRPMADLTPPPWTSQPAVGALSLQFPARPGAVYHRVILPGGQADITVYPLLFGGGRLLNGPCGELEDGGADRVYDYLRVEDAIHAAHAWDGVEDPVGWYRKGDGFGRWISSR